MDRGPRSARSARDYNGEDEHEDEDVPITEGEIGIPSRRELLTGYRGEDVHSQLMIFKDRFLNAGVALADFRLMICFDN